MKTSLSYLIAFCDSLPPLPEDIEVDEKTLDLIFEEEREDTVPCLRCGMKCNYAEFALGNCGDEVSHDFGEDCREDFERYGEHLEHLAEKASDAMEARDFFLMGETYR